MLRISDRLDAVTKIERKMGSIEDLLETQRKELFSRVNEYDRNYQK